MTGLETLLEEHMILSPIIAFFAGMLTSITPCSLSGIPLIISYVSSATKETKKNRNCDNILDPRNNCDIARGNAPRGFIVVVHRPGRLNGGTCTPNLGSHLDNPFDEPRREEHETGCTRGFACRLSDGAFLIPLRNARFNQPVCVRIRF